MLGDFDFYAPMAQILNQKQFKNIMKLYEQSGFDIADLDEYGIDAHLFGWVWQHQGISKLPPILINTDGDTLQDCLITYSVENEKKARKQLEKLEFVDYNENDDMYIWFGKPLFKQTLSSIDSKSPILLGTMRFDGKKLKIKVNSKKRCEKCRELLKNIEGITFENDSIEWDFLLTNKI